jgi:hypothetical protein
MQRCVACVTGESNVKFPNLYWAIDNRRLAHYEFSACVHMERTRFSRCLNGLTEFAPDEKDRIAEILEFPAEWLFLGAMPPRVRRVSSHSDKLAERINE